jgi:putative ABC transport system permease protein
VRTFVSRLLDVILRRSRDERLADEVRTHLDLLANDLVARGMTPADAALAARKMFGNPDRVRIAHREQRGFSWIDSLAQDVRFALRLLTRERGFALTAILVLAVGIGVNNMFFAIVYAHKFRGLPIPQPGRVLSVSAFDDRAPDRLISLNEFDDLSREQTTFAGLAAYAAAAITVGDDNRTPDRFDAAYVSSNALGLLGIAPVIGTLPSADYDRSGTPAVVMLGVNAWQSRYNADTSIVGRTILINGMPADVVAVLPERAGFPSAAGVWLPLGQWPGMQQSRDARALRVLGRVRDGVTVSDARLEIEALFGRFESTRPETNRNVRARVMPLNQRLLGDLRGWEPFIMAGVIVILVACANVANLMIARALQRSPEIAIRTSLGASRTRIIRQLLVEAGMLALCGAVAGGVISVAGVRLVRSAIPDGTLPYWLDYSMDARVFAALIGISLATIILFGLVPALQASRTDVNRTLKDGARGAVGHRRSRAWTGAFLTAELALAMIMLTQIALATLTAQTTIPTDAAIHTTAVMTAAITLPTAGYPTPERRNDFFRRLDERLTGRADVIAASRSTMLPGDGGFGNRRVAIEGEARRADGEGPAVLAIDVAPSYVATLDLAAVKGREFSAIDGTAGNETVIVNQRFAEVFLGEREPIGTRIAVAPANAPRDVPSQWLTVVGVTPTIRQQGAGGVEQQSPVIYLPIAAASPATSILMVRHALDPEATATLLREEVRAVDPNVALYRMRTLMRAVDDAQWNRRVSSYLAGTVCILSVLLAIVGLYAVTAQRVTLKTPEIGLRMALGARSVQIVRLVLYGLRVPLLLGVVLGTLGAMAWDRSFSAGSRDLYASAPRTVLTIAGFIVTVVIASCVIPIRRAVRLSPTQALRHE